MWNVVTFVLAVLTVFSPNGIESQPTNDDEFCDDGQLKQEVDFLRTQLERKDRLLRTCEGRPEPKCFSEHTSDARTIETTSAIVAPRPTVVINLVQRLNESSSSSFSTSPAKYVTGVTKREERIYVLSYRNVSLRVFEDRTPFRLLSEIPLPQIGNPSGIVYSNRSKCFYVADRKHDVIWKITTAADDNQTQVTEWRRGITEPHTISLSSDGHLLVLRDGGQRPSSDLEIYNESDARLIRSLRLPNSIINPAHAIEAKTGGQFIISHKSRDKGNGAWAISRLTTSGQNLVIDDQSQPRSESEKLDQPYYLSLDSKDDLLFVADYRNDRVILLDSNDLEFRQILLTKETNRIQQPNSLYYDHEKKQLIVGQRENINYYDRGVVEVYEIV